MKAKLDKHIDKALAVTAAIGITIVIYKTLEAWGLI